MEAIKIQDATGDDLVRLSELEQSIFTYDLITPRSMKHLLQSKSAKVSIALYQESPIGYSILLTKKQSRVGRIYSLGVLHEAHRKGVGKRLLQHAEMQAEETGCDRIHLELHFNNISGLVFYLTAGYGIRGYKEAYYTDGNPAILLKKSIHVQDHDSPQYRS